MEGLQYHRDYHLKKENAGLAQLKAWALSDALDTKT